MPVWMTDPTADDGASGAHYVAVYGTLKRRRSNHRLLGRARFLGTDHLRSIVLFDLGPYPGARRKPSLGVLVEVYEVGDTGLARLDELEGYNPKAPERGLYTRQRLSTRHGDAWVYLYNGSVRGCRRISRGSW